MNNSPMAVKSEPVQQQQHNDADVAANNSGGNGMNIIADFQKLQLMIMEWNESSSQNTHGIGFLDHEMLPNGQLLKERSAGRRGSVQQSGKV